MLEIYDTSNTASLKEKHKRRHFAKVQWKKTFQLQKDMSRR